MAYYAIISYAFYVLASVTYIDTCIYLDTGKQPKDEDELRERCKVEAVEKIELNKKGN